MIPDKRRDQRLSGILIVCTNELEWEQAQEIMNAYGWQWYEEPRISWGNVKHYLPKIVINVDNSSGHMMFSPLNFYIEHRYVKEDKSNLYTFTEFVKKYGYILYLNYVNEDVIYWEIEEPKPRRRKPK